MKKNISEEQLRNIVAESVKKVLKENNYGLEYEDCKQLFKVYHNMTYSLTDFKNWLIEMPTEDAKAVIEMIDNLEGASRRLMQNACELSDDEAAMML